ncbi:hypothetical protein GCM10007157_26740 [Vreelandella hamiltonii]|uniref:Uncharacterized protein n=1 Tax=Vreelandella hamiltonii TaxID=502829 RepID=A0A8H9I3T4_9GAMM|nr:hypothetical protein GCM10007157_26740 [Halomonas hamiltonii]
MVVIALHLVSLNGHHIALRQANHDVFGHHALALFVKLSNLDELFAAPPAGLQVCLQTCHRRMGTTGTQQ